jgi:putative inorganic carbon (HCO3(-)) transporter
VLLASSALASALGLSVFIAHGAGFASRARGPVGHYMTFAGQLLLFVSLATGIALLAGERRVRFAALAAAALGAAALAATYTRSSWLGLAAALIVMLALTRPRWLPALAIVIIALVMFSPGHFRARLVSVFDPQNVWNRERTYMWSAGVRIFRDHPITGVGLQDLHAVYDRYRPPESSERAGHLHSVPVQIAASMGMVGLAAFAWLYGALLWSAARDLRAACRARGLGAGVRLGVTAALAGFLVAGLFEWNFGDEELLYPLFVMVGIAWAARDWDAAHAQAPRALDPAPAGAGTSALAAEGGR